MPSTPPLHLLLIEDNAADARYIEELLREPAPFVDPAGEREELGSGIEADATAPPALTHVSSIDRGLDRLDTDIDVILLDLNLPDSTGLRTLETILASADVPIVVLTGLQGRETGIAAIRAGADDYLVKDEINSDLLLRSVYHAIERRQHERELRRYETLIERSADVNAIIDPDGTIRYLTPSVEHVLGYPPSALVGRDAFTLIHPDDRPRVNESLEAVLGGGRLPPMEFRVEHEDGSWLVLEARGRNLLDDRLIEGIVVYTRDVTERVERERKLEQFAQVVSHDLRNPLGIARMYLEEVRRSGDISDLDRIKEALERMDTLVDTLLSLAREGEAIDEREPVAIDAVASRAWSQVETHQAVLKVELDDLTVRADPERIQTLFENLFRNAVEHGGEDVEVRVGRSDGGIAIEDTGNGIAPEVRDEVFDLGSSTAGGTGTGLAIVKEIVEAHGWMIRPCERAGGARFEIDGMDVTSTS